MEILKNFGFDPVLLVAQIVNFLIVLYLLKRFLYKPLFDMLKKRDTAIKEGLKQAEEAKVTLEKTLQDEKKILQKAQEEAQKIIEEAREEAIQLSKDSEERTKRLTDKMISDAKIQIELDAKETERKLSENVGKLAANMLVKSLEGLIGDNEQKQIVTKALKYIKKAD